MSNDWIDIKIKMPECIHENLAEDRKDYMYDSYDSEPVLIRITDECKRKLFDVKKSNFTVAYLSYYPNIRKEYPNAHEYIFWEDSKVIDSEILPEDVIEWMYLSV